MKNNNLVSVFIVIVIVYLICLFLPFGTFTANTGPTLQYLSAQERVLTATGLSGNLSLLGIAIPYWFLIILDVVSATIVIFNIKRLIQIPKIIPILINVFVLLWLSLGYYVYLSLNGSINAGLLLMTIATLTSLFLTAKS